MKTTRYEVQDSFAGGEDIVEAASMREAAEEYVLRHYDVDLPATRSVSVEVRELGAPTTETVVVRIDPDEPYCADGTYDHEWTHVSVYGDGDGVSLTERCQLCGLARESTDGTVRYIEPTPPPKRRDDCDNDIIGV